MTSMTSESATTTRKTRSGRGERPLRRALYGGRLGAGRPLGPLFVGVRPAEGSRRRTPNDPDRNRADCDGDVVTDELATSITDRPGRWRRCWWALRRPWRRQRLDYDPLSYMQELAAKGDNEYRRAYREACLDVLGEDPNDWSI